MSFLLKNQWQAWARAWSLTHVPEKGWTHRTERVLGLRNDMLFRVLWGRDEDPGLHILIRFPETTDLDRLRAALIADPALDVLPGNGAARHKMKLDRMEKQPLRFGSRPEFLLGSNALLWRRTFAFHPPKPEQVQAWTTTLIEALARATPGFDGRCEICSSGQARQYVVVDELPTMMCTTCQERLRLEGDMAERAYEMSESLHIHGLLLATLAAVAGAAAWAGLAVLTQRIFAVVAMGLGALVAWAYKRGAGRVDVVGRGVAVALTLMSVVLGQVVLFALWIAQGSPDLGFSLEAGWYAYLTAWAETPVDSAVPVLFGLFGAWVALAALQQPKLASKLEAVGSPSEDEEQKKAA